MSSPSVDLGAVFGNLVNALTSAFNTLINVISENLPTLIELGLVAGLTTAVIYTVRRYGRELVDFFRGFIRV
jgi:hypothetical protein